MNGPGIDYGYGLSNTDTTNGIRFGCISQHSVAQAWADSSQPDYGDISEDQDETDESAEPLGWYVDEDGYQLTDCLDSDIMVIKSPYYTFAPFCSPCVPGAGDLNNAHDGGVKTYALAGDWFEEGVAPYPLYSVADDKLVAA